MNVSNFIFILPTYRYNTSSMLSTIIMRKQNDEKEEEQAAAKLKKKGERTHVDTSRLDKTKKEEAYK